MLKVHTPSDIYAPIGPYAQAVEATSVQRLLFISGTMGLTPEGILAGDFEAQAHRVWSNIDATLAAAGMGRQNLARPDRLACQRERLAAGRRDPPGLSGRSQGGDVRGAGRPGQPGLAD